MSRFRVLSLALPMLATACKVAPTPREYFDHQTPAAVERQAVAEEVQDRVLAMAQALNRGDLTESMIALAPGPDASVITPLDSVAVRGADEIATALQRSVGGPVEIAEVEVQVGPRQNVAWFQAVLARPAASAGGVDGDGEGEGEGSAEAGPLRMSGIYVRYEGAWQLVQAHLSRVTRSEAPSPSSPAPAADSGGGG